MAWDTTVSHPDQKEMVAVHSAPETHTGFAAPEKCSLLS